MNFTPFYMPQGSPDWHQARVGLLTGSCAKWVIKVRKRGSEELEGRKDLRLRLVAERLTGLAVEDIPHLPAHMERGKTIEPQAFVAYEAITRQLACRVGFIRHNELKAGCSPDGYVGEWHGEHGLIELKCPKSTTHLEYIKDGVLPPEYEGQVIHGMWLTGAAWCDFCSFDPRFGESIELFRVRIERDETKIAAYQLALSLFLSEVDRDEQVIRERMKEAA